MNKTELIAGVALESGLSIADTARFLDSFIGTVSETLQKDVSVSLVGFGTFMVRDRKERTGRNPQTGEEMQILARKSPVFKAGKALKERVSGF